MPTTSLTPEVRSILERSTITEEMLVLPPGQLGQCRWKMEQIGQVPYFPVRSTFTSGGRHAVVHEVQDRAFKESGTMVRTIILVVTNY